MSERRASNRRFYSTTVSMDAHELPPPQPDRERAITTLRSAMGDAMNFDILIADKIMKLMMAIERGRVAKRGVARETP